MRSGEQVRVFNRRNMPLAGERLGTVFYCIGVTTDYRSRILDTADSHVSVLVDIVRNHDFDRIVYLSSTRIYAEQESGREDAPIRVTPMDPLEIYGLSKLVGESIIASLGVDRGVVVRLSNVLGPSGNSRNFVFDLCRQAVSGTINLFSPLEARKDYVHIDDVVRLLHRIGRASRMNLYNVANGTGVATQDIIGSIRSLVPCDVVVAPDARAVSFPEIDTTRLRTEFGGMEHSALEILPTLIESMKKEKVSNESA